MAHVICCNDRVVQVVIGDLKFAEGVLNSLRLEDFNRQISETPGRYQDFQDFKLHVHWHIQIVPCIRQYKLNQETV